MTVIRSLQWRIDSNRLFAFIQTIGSFTKTVNSAKRKKLNRKKLCRTEMLTVWKNKRRQTSERQEGFRRESSDSRLFAFIKSCAEMLTSHRRVLCEKEMLMVLNHEMQTDEWETKGIEKAARCSVCCFSAHSWEVCVSIFSTRNTFQKNLFIPQEMQSFFIFPNIQTWKLMHQLSDGKGKQTNDRKQGFRTESSRNSRLFCFFFTRLFAWILSIVT